MASSQNSIDKIKAFYGKHLILSNIILICCVALFLCFFSLFVIDIWTNHGNTTLVPEVRKKSFAEAKEILKKDDLKCEIADSVYDSNMAPGTVKEMWPHPGTHVKPGRVIYLTVNSFQPQRITISMPLVGVSFRQAVTYLESLNIRNVRVVYVPSDFPDLVEGAKYNGENIKPGIQIPVNGLVVLEVGALRQRPKNVEDISIDQEVESMIGDNDTPDTGIEYTDESNDDDHAVADPDVFN